MNLIRLLDSEGETIWLSPDHIEKTAPQWIVLPEVEAWFHESNRGRCDLKTGIPRHLRTEPLKTRTGVVVEMQVLGTRILMSGDSSKKVYSVLEDPAVVAECYAEAMKGRLQDRQVPLVVDGVWIDKPD